MGLPLEGRILAGFLLSVAFAYFATPLAIRVAGRLDFYDRPTGYKGHAAATPYLGGAAVIGGFLVAVLLLTGDWDRTLPVAGGVLVLWVVGTIDDRRSLTPLPRLAVEFTVATGLWAAGLGWDLGLGPWLNLATTALWIIAIVNAFNLFDNMDGAASTMAAVVAAGLAVLGIARGDAWLSVMAVALSGACIGFLPHNLSSPARIFLGDGGSMPIGLAVAALTMIGVADAAPQWQSLAMGLLLVGVPALDTSLVIISRTRRGVSVLTGGRDHLTHRTQERLQTARAVAVALGGTQALVSALALVAIGVGSAAVVVAVLAYLVAAGVAIAVLESRVPAELAAVDQGVRVIPPVRRRPQTLAAVATVIPLAVGIGVSPFFFGFYDAAIWVPVGLVLLVMATAGAIAWPLQLTGPAVLALVGLAALAALALASVAWSESVEQAVVEANRLMVYVVLLGLLLLIVRTEQIAIWLMGVLGAMGVVVALAVLGKMLLGDGSSLFLAGRLDGPLGYINGEAGFFLLALWPCLAASEQRRSILLAGAGLMGATLLGALLLLSQSRGVALALLVSLVVVIALVPGRLRRCWAVIVAAAFLALVGPSLLDVYETGASGQTLPDDVIGSAASAALLAAAGAGVLWATVLAIGRLSLESAWPRRSAALALGVVVIAAVAIGAVSAPSIARQLDRQYTAFVHLDIGPQGSNAGAPSRLVRGGGNRYDYWRVAWSMWRDRPVIGFGAGNYAEPYFARRATAEDIRQPHSVELQALGELGLIGALLLIACAAGVTWGAWRTARAARESAGTRLLAVAAIGTVTGWFVHTSVDWLHLLPGVTAMALASIAILVRCNAATTGATGATSASRGRRARLVPAALVGLLLAAAGVSLTRQALSQHFRAQGESALAADPATALRDADRALRLTPESVSSYYLKAAALARFNQPDTAKRTLQEAARREPRNYVTWALLGDLAVRTGDAGAASSYYGWALSLNPRDPGLRQAVERSRARD